MSILSMENGGECMITPKRNIGYRIGYYLAFFSILLALGTSPSMPLGAQNANPASDFEYDLNEKGTGVLITKYKGDGKNVIIPSTIEDFPVVELKGAFAETNVESVVIPDSVTYLTSDGYLSCFFGCKSLKKITLPKGLEYIDSYSFAYSGLESIRVPDSVVYMGKLVFWNCKQLKTVTIGNGVEVIGSGAFKACTSLTTLSIGSGVKQIADDAFSNCTALESISIPDSVVYMGKLVFWNCKQLKTVTIGNGVEVIGSGAFKACTSLTTLSIGSGVKQIADDAFSNCTALESISIPDNVIYIGKEAFSSCEQLKTVTIGNGVQVIDEYAFGGCTALTTVSIGSGIKCIRSKVFGDCTALTSFNIGVAYLGNTDTDNSPTFKIESFDIELIKFTEHYSDKEVEVYRFLQGYASDAFVGCTALSLKEKKKIRDSGYTGEFGSSKK